MKVNRNTINSDIRYWYDNIKEEVRKQRDDLIVQQFGRLEAQRARIVENISTNKVDKIKSEKLLLDVDSRINNILMRIGPEQDNIEQREKINESLIKELVLFLIVKYAKDPLLEEKQLISEIVNMQQCTVRDARQILAEMNILGLECCQKYREVKFGYDLLEFALLRKYVRYGDDFLKKVTHYPFYIEFYRLKNTSLRRDT